MRHQRRAHLRQLGGLDVMAHPAIRNQRGKASVRDRRMLARICNDGADRTQQIQLAPYPIAPAIPPRQRERHIVERAGLEPSQRFPRQPRRPAEQKRVGSGKTELGKEPRQQRCRQVAQPKEPNAIDAPLLGRHASPKPGQRGCRVRPRHRRQSPARQLGPPARIERRNRQRDEQVVRRVGPRMYQIDIHQRR